MLAGVLEGLKTLAETIGHIKAIAEAIRSGRDYLKVRHPDVRAEVGALLVEMGKNVLLAKQASAILTHFRFAFVPGAEAEELRTFNNHCVLSKTQAQSLRGSLEDLRSHCSRVRDHAARISKRVGSGGFQSLFALLGLASPEKEEELGRHLERLAFEDFAVANSGEVMLQCLETSLQDIQDALGPEGCMLPENLPAAAALLAEYGRAFETLEFEATIVAREVRSIAEDLCSDI